LENILNLVLDKYKECTHKTLSNEYSDKWVNITDEIDIGNGFIPFCNKEPLEVIISDYLGVIFFVDERKKVNVRLNKTTTQSFKINITHAIVKNEGREFHNIINKFKGLPLFRGIINQKRELRKYVVAQMKSHNRKWVLPIYI
jgi:hypothetical protein